MSTILHALQKNKLDQAIHSASMPTADTNITLFKVGISIALLVIISLLSTLIYLQLNPHNETAPVATNITQLEQLTNRSNLVKVSFEAQPLAPTASQEVVTPTPSQEIKVVTAERPQVAPSTPPQQEALLVADTPKTTERSKTIDNHNSEQEINYEEVPEDIKKRFELALMLTEMEDSPEDVALTSEPDENIDGSDIRQMSTSFQRKVAAIHYDSHMYSSVLNDRWIRINGETLKEGDFDSTGELELLEIQPQRSIFRVQRQSFSLESLTDWQGY